MRYGVRCSAHDIKTIVIMRGTGHTQKEIGDLLGISSQRVSYHLKKVKEKSLEEGVDETLRSVLLGGGEAAAVAGLASLDMITRLEWYMHHYRVNSFWLIQRLWQMCDEEEDHDGTRNIVNASLGEFADSYGFDLDKWVMDRKAKKMKGAGIKESGGEEDE